MVNSTNLNQFNIPGLNASSADRAWASGANLAKKNEMNGYYSDLKMAKIFKTRLNANTNQNSIAHNAKKLAERVERLRKRKISVQNTLRIIKGGRRRTGRKTRRRN